MTTETAATSPPARRSRGIGAIVADAPSQARLFGRRIGQTLALLWEAGPGATLSLALAAIPQSLLPAAALWVMKLLIDAVTAPAPSAATIFTLLALEFGIGAAVIAFEQAIQAVEQVFGERLTYRVTNRLLICAAALDLSHFENPAFYDQLQRAQREIGFRPINRLTQVVGLVRSGLSLAAMSAPLVRLSPLIVVALVAGFLPALFTQGRAARLWYRLIQGRTPETRQMLYLNWILTHDQAAKEVRVFDLAPYLLGRYRALFDRHHAETRAAAFRRAILSALAGIFGSGVMIACGGYVLLEVAAGRFTAGDLALTAAALLGGVVQLRATLGAAAAIYEHGLFLDDLFSFWQLKPAVVSAPEAPAMAGRVERGIAFDHVSFRYPGAADEAVRDVSLSIAPGETVALVGENGAGKTTLIKLLCRLYDPTAGSIRIDDVDLRAGDLGSLRSRIGVLFQDYTRYHLRARENIGIGRVEAVDDLARIVQAARESGADADVRRLPDGYDTILGRWFEGGQELSGGEWQKVALARGFMRNADILVLDEPTASLDARSEYEVFQQVRTFPEGSSTGGAAPRWRWR
ncbi:MAG: ABC transporter ATP-binding protein [Chloroflexi bacterium]|nr:ABC transporter ATP-binding protein [Chloroflexota bacterium]